MLLMLCQSREQALTRALQHSLIGADSALIGDDAPAQRGDVPYTLLAQA